MRDIMKNAFPRRQSKPISEVTAAIAPSMFIGNNFPFMSAKAFSIASASKQCLPDRSSRFAISRSLTARGSRVCN